ncbi:hypothetical protein [Streptomyces sp. EN16]|uniref:hypothetical protein n=1 Tax=Streptomyces sp. EN16 TaxID=212773 RepID=UPI000851F18B|nr:hypothetical protein [Streptomyces sp. EN16]
MSEFKIECLHASSDTIVASTSEERHIVSYPHGADSIYVSPDDARTFARGILALADEVDGGEEKAGNRPKVGDRVTVVEDDPDDETGKFVGLVGTLTSVDGGAGTPFRVKFGEGSHGQTNGYWWCRRVEPVSPTAATITRPTREAYLHRAAELLGRNTYSAHDLMRLADYLAGEGA